MTRSSPAPGVPAVPPAAPKKEHVGWWYLRWGAVIGTGVGAVAAVAGGNFVGGAVLVLAIAGVTPILKPNFGRRAGLGAFALYAGALGPYFWGMAGHGDPPPVVAFWFAVGAAVATTLIYWVDWSRTDG